MNASSILQLGGFDEQSTLIAMLKSGELDKTTDLILALADFDKDIKLTPNPKEYDPPKMLRDFIEGLCTELSESQQLNGIQLLQLNFE